MIYRWQGLTVGVGLEARGRCGLLPLGACERAPSEALLTSGVGKKKKEKKKKRGHCNQAPRAIALTSLGILPNALGSTRMPDHCPFPRPYEEQLVQNILLGLSGTGCFLCGLQVAGTNHHSYL